MDGDGHVGRRRYRGDVAATDGTSLVGEQPEVDAVAVEDVAAGRKEAEEAVAAKVDEADCAFDAVIFLRRREKEGRERFDGGCIEA